LEEKGSNMKDIVAASAVGAVVAYHVGAFLWTMWGMSDIFAWNNGLFW